MTRIITAFCLALCLIAPIAAAQTPAGWTDDFEAAKAQAKADGKGLLLDFTGSDWCGWCIKLDKEVFSTEAFKAYAAKNWVLVYLDFPRGKQVRDKAQNQKLQAKYGVKGFPTIIVLDSDGMKIGKTGYQKGGPEAYIKHLDEIKATGAKLKAERAELEKAAAGGDAGAVKKLFALDVRGGKYASLADAKAALAKLTIPDGEREALAKSCMTDLEVDAAMKGVTRDPKTHKAPAKRFYDMIKAGYGSPAAQDKVQAFYILGMRHAESVKDATVFETGLNAMRKHFGSNPQAAQFFTQMEAKLKALKAGGEDSGGGSGSK